MKLKYTFAIKEVLGMYLAVSVGEDNAKFDGVLRLNETGKRILELLQDGLEEETIVSILKEEYDATEEELRNEVKKIVDQLRDEGMIEE